MIAGDSPRHQLRELWQLLGHSAHRHRHFRRRVGLSRAARCRRRSAPFPGPVQVWQQAQNLYADHQAERVKESAFYEAQQARNAKLIADGKADRVRERTYTGKPTYLDQILTSLKTVFIGFLLASLIAIPLGVMCGLSQSVNGALNPLIQIFKPVSPLAWLPIVTMVVSAALSQSVRRAAEVARHLGDHGDAVLAVADADQHRRSASRRSTRICSTSAACCGCRPGGWSPSSSCRRRCR